MFQTLNLKLVLCSKEYYNIIGANWLMHAQYVIITVGRPAGFWQTLTLHTSIQTYPLTRQTFRRVLDLAFSIYFSLFLFLHTQRSSLNKFVKQEMFSLNIYFS